MPQTSVRTAVKVRLIDLLAARPNLRNVQVVYATSLEDLQAEAITLGGVTGQVSIRDFRSGRKARDDTFTVEVHFWTALAHATAQSADERVEELYVELESMLADNPQLATEAGPLDGVRWAAQLNSDVQYLEPVTTTEGWCGLATAYVQVKTILT